MPFKLKSLSISSATFMKGFRSCPGNVELDSRHTRNAVARPCSWAAEHVDSTVRGTRMANATGDAACRLDLAAARLSSPGLAESALPLWFLTSILGAFGFGAGNGICLPAAIMSSSRGRRVSKRYSFGQPTRHSLGQPAPRCSSSRQTVRPMRQFLPSDPGGPAQPYFRITPTFRIVAPSDQHERLLAKWRASEPRCGWTAGGYACSNRKKLPKWY